MQRIGVIWPRHPTLITANISANNIIPYKRRAHKEIKSAVTKSYKEAVRSDQCKEWNKEITQELENMIKLNVWTIRGARDGDHPITSMWVSKVKKDDQQQVTKYKVQLCAQGFHQIQGLDYPQTFSPTGRISKLQELISNTTVNNY
ncbi:hypothetical protein O181_031335 [Austropuccinia psidii MF-1]|uniref:Reverse transcriptase Ty1/copia-type domain-containing protein n=1 Tax=Austropuccinia psidii MF-1 TaxID=1389203 RepID=A0A9Q3H733_9BASI|nr:hypothetical protein [Austropuccinia psidii MF-1]